MRHVCVEVLALDLPNHTGAGLQGSIDPALASGTSPAQNIPEMRIVFLPKGQ
jgi:hypothetical protein